MSTDTKILVLPKIIEAWGHVPEMLAMHDDRPLWEQIHDEYSHGGGWRTQPGWDFTIDDGVWIAKYPGDPDMTMIDKMMIGDETLVLFDYGYILWTDGDNFKMARID